MNHLLRLCFWGLTFIFLVFPSPGGNLLAQGMGFITKAEVVFVIDGDTFVAQAQGNVAQAQGKKFKVRLLYVDTPESVHREQFRNSQLGRTISKAVKGWLKGRQVRLVCAGQQSFGRELCEVYLDGQNFNLSLVAMGMSRYVQDFGVGANHSAYFQAQRQAQAKKLGIWGFVP